MRSATCLIATALASAFIAPAQAATLTKYFEYSPGDACQLSIPTTDTQVRPRANGYRNEGTSNQFVICGMGGYENGTVVSMIFLNTSTDGQAHTMSCTGVTGLVGWGGPYYSTKTLIVPASSYSYEIWDAEDFGGTAGQPIYGGINLSVTCTVPPGVALQGFESENLVDVGN
jgi:hypothetical protein